MLAGIFGMVGDAAKYLANASVRDTYYVVIIGLLPSIDLLVSVVTLLVDVTFLWHPNYPSHRTHHCRYHSNPTHAKAMNTNKVRHQNLMLESIKEFIRARSKA